MAMRPVDTEKDRACPTVAGQALSIDALRRD